VIRAGFFIGVIMPETRKYTVVDLFAGVGGLSYGFSRNEHYEIILANEMQKDIAKAYTLNHPSVNMLQGDIKDLSENVLCQAIGNRTVDVVVGGPPCQSYSTLGKRQMDARANLFMEYKRVLRILHPRAFLFENVKGILSMDKGTLF
jgi:DNA (cytosine-5)-methyltransferase 1